MIQATEPKTATPGQPLIWKSWHQIGMDGASYGSLHTARFLPEVRKIWIQSGEIISDNGKLAAMKPKLHEE